MSDQDDAARGRIDAANGSGEPETYGPAYQRLRETLRELIGEADADATERETAAKLRRRRGYVEPERAGILRQPIASDTPNLENSGDSAASQSEPVGRIGDGRAVLEAAGIDAFAADPPKQSGGLSRLTQRFDRDQTSERSGEGLTRSIKSPHANAFEPTGLLIDPDQPAKAYVGSEASLDKTEPARSPQPRSLATALEESASTDVAEGAAAEQAMSGASAIGSAVKAPAKPSERYIESEPAPIPISRKPIGQLALSRRRKPAGEQVPAQGGGAAAGTIPDNKAIEKAPLTGPITDEEIDDDALWYGKPPAAPPPKSRLRLLLPLGLGAGVLIGAGLYLGATMGGDPLGILKIGSETEKPVALVVSKPIPEATEAADVSAKIEDDRPALADDAADTVDASLDEPILATETQVDNAALDQGVAELSANEPAEAEPIPLIADPEPVVAAKQPPAVVEVAPTPVKPAVEAASAPVEQPAVAAVEPVPAAPVAEDPVVAAAESDVEAVEPAEPALPAAAAEVAPAAVEESRTAVASEPSAAVPTPPSSPVGSSEASLEQVGALTASPQLAADACEPTIEVFPRPAGFSRISVRSECRKDELVRFTYGGVVFNRRLDANGALDIDIDCFLGLSVPVDIAFKDGSIYEATLTADDLDKVAKVAVIWNKAIDLDLHAFQRDVRFNERGHVWSARPASYSDALQQIASTGQGAGFLSSIADARSSDSRVEVYTFLYPPTAGSGFVRFAVDYQTRGSRPIGAACRGGADASPAFQVVYTLRGNQAVREFSEFGAVDCGTTLTDPVRFNTELLPELDVSK